MPWAAMGGTLAYNWTRHLRGKPTICSMTRALPGGRWIGVGVWCAVTVWFVPHILNGGTDAAR